MLDTDAPVITCPADQMIGTNDGQSTVSLVWEKPAAVDNSGHDPNVTCTPTSGTNFAVGTTSVECVAIDDAGNRGSCVFVITVEGNLFRSCVVFVLFVLFLFLMKTELVFLCFKMIYMFATF